MSIVCAPLDTIRITSKNTTQLDVSHVKQPVLSGLNGTVDLEDWNTATHTSGPFTLTHQTGSDDWYFDITAPAATGRFRVVVVLLIGGARRTKYGELKVEVP